MLQKRSHATARPLVVLGATGTLGAELCRRATGPLLGLDRKRLDLQRPHQVGEFLLRVRPAAVVHAAATTDVDWCQRHPRACFAVNAYSVAAAAEACRRLGVPLVYISSSFVFGQRGSGHPWHEEQCPCPGNVYAHSKYLGERHARECPQHLIVRTCGLFHHRRTRRRGFVQNILSQAAAGKRVRVVQDQWANPTYVPDLVRALCFLLHTCRQGKAPWGIYHVVNGPAVTWYEFARVVIRAAGYQVAVEPITSQEFPALAPRPCCAVLATEKYARLGGPAMRPWYEALAGCLQHLRSRVEQEQSPPLASVAGMPRTAAAR